MTSASPFVLLGYRLSLASSVVCVKAICVVVMTAALTERGD